MDKERNYADFSSWRLDPSKLGRIALVFLALTGALHGAMHYDMDFFQSIIFSACFVIFYVRITEKKTEIVIKDDGKARSA